MERENIVNAFVGDVKEFIWKNRSTIYTVAIIYLADKFLFDGKFKAKLSELVDTLLNKLSTKIDKE